MDAFDVGDWDDDAAPAPPSAGMAGPSAEEELEALLQAAEIGGSMQQPVQAPKPAKPSATSGDDASSTAPPQVELGFVAPYPWPPARPGHFPSKVGGEPVWLLPNRLPSGEALQCGRCGRRLRFLMQLYCPRPEVAHGYHRSLMLFCCGGPCLRHAAGWRALRCNLPQDTPHYVEHEDGSFTAHGFDGLLAASPAAAAAGGSASASASHGGAASTTPPPAPAALPELLVSVDLEGDWQGIVAGADAAMREEAARLLSAYEAAEGPEWASASKASEPGGRAQSARGSSSAAASATDDEDDCDDDDDEMEAEGSFFAFQRRTSAHPEQALRYSRDPAGTPLWAGLRGQPPPGVPPPCERCGAPRSFEFQLMPQLLCAIESAEEGGSAAAAANAAAPAPPAGVRPAGEGAAAVLGGESDLDFGVVAVYSCSATCAAPDDPASSAYAHEFCWHQPLE